MRVASKKNFILNFFGRDAIRAQAESRISDRFFFGLRRHGRGFRFRSKFSAPPAGHEFLPSVADRFLVCMEGRRGRQREIFNVEGH